MFKFSPVRPSVMLIAVSAFLACVVVAHADTPSLKIGCFEIDATPPIGAPLAYNQLNKRTATLSCRGVVLLIKDQKPIVLAAIDWIGVGNDAYSAFRKALAEAAQTTPSRVAFHALHQHDAPRCDFSAEAILAEHGMGGEMFDVEFAKEVIRRAAAGVSQARADAVAVTHVVLGQAKIEKVASNRRILGDDGKVRFTRWTATRDAKIRAFPVGTIDPFVKLIGFWSNDTPVAALTYYATHPQSYYRTGDASPDFPGIARNLRDEATDVLHVHFNGAGGDIGAGKWNDGSPDNRMTLANRVAEGMAQAWQASLDAKTPIEMTDIGWEVVPVALPPTPYLDAERLSENVTNEKMHRSTRLRSAVHLAWLRRCEAGDVIELSCLKIGKARVLHMPGELFVEYQLAAQKMRPDLFVCMAAYSDYAPGYIGTEISYSQGGYETSPIASRVDRSVEKVLHKAMRSLLQAGGHDVAASETKPDAR